MKREIGAFMYTVIIYIYLKSHAYALLNSPKVLKENIVNEYANPMYFFIKCKETLGTIVFHNSHGMHMSNRPYHVRDVCWRKSPRSHYIRAILRTEEADGSNVPHFYWVQLVSKSMNHILSHHIIYLFIYLLDYFTSIRRSLQELATYIRGGGK